ncbi:MAG: GyrI-like domain-containing protein [Bacteroidota bacterium]
MLEILDLPTTSLIGLGSATSLAEGKGPMLWGKFRPRAKDLPRVQPGFYNVSIYPEELTMDSFTPTTKYTAWVGVAVAEGQEVPQDLESLRVGGGLYAKIIYQGLPQDFGPFAARLYGQLIPEAGYRIDNTRAHFEYLPPGYRPDDPEATEEVWVPVRQGA